MSILGICIVAIIGAILAITLKHTTPQLSITLTLITGVIVFIAVCSVLPQITEKINSLINAAGVKTEFAAILFKSVGICFLCQFSSDICKDAGQSALAGRVELAGKIMILISSLPLMEEVLNTASSLLGG